MACDMALLPFEALCVCVEYMRACVCACLCVKIDTEFNVVCGFSGGTVCLVCAFMSFMMALFRA